MISQVVDNYKPTLADCYSSDEDLISKWHTCAGQGLEACIDREIADLTKANVKLQEVRNNSDLVGYFGSETFEGKSFLTGFFVKPKYRNKEVMKEFWNMIKSEFKGPFYCGLYKSNEPAIRFIERNQGKPIAQVSTEDGTAVVYEIEA